MEKEEERKDGMKKKKIISFNFPNKNLEETLTTNVIPSPAGLLGWSIMNEKEAAKLRVVPLR